MILYYVRHGDPIYDPDSLTELGKLQASAVGKRLALHGMDRIFSSTSNRARQTAQPLCDILNKEPELQDWCSEVHAWEALTLINEEGRKVWCTMDPGTKKWLSSKEVRELGKKWYTHPAFAGTNYGAYIQQIQQQCDAFLASLGYRHDPENNCYYAENPQYEKVALFGHAGAGGAILSCMLDIPYCVFAQTFDMSHTGVTVISFEEEDGIVLPKVLTFSNDSHLYREGYPTLY